MKALSHEKTQKHHPQATEVPLFGPMKTRMGACHKID